MSDAPDAPAEEPTQDQPETDWEAEAKKWEKRSKANFEQAKANSAAAQRLAEIEESSKTDLQRAIDRAEAAERRVVEFESERQISTWKTEVSDETGVPVEWLRGTTREELAAHAEVLKPAAPSKRGPVVPGPGDIPESPTNPDAAWFGNVLRGNNT